MIAAIRAWWRWRRAYAARRRLGDPRIVQTRAQLSRDLAAAFPPTREKGNKR